MHSYSGQIVPVRMNSKLKPMRPPTTRGQRRGALISIREPLEEHSNASDLLVALSGPDVRTDDDALLEEIAVVRAAAAK